jgi:hypothetical protein
MVVLNMIHIDMRIYTHTHTHTHMLSAYMRVISGARVCECVCAFRACVRVRTCMQMAVRAM